jgi:hypothetical protein
MLLFSLAASALAPHAFLGASAYGYQHPSQPHGLLAVPKGHPKNAALRAISKTRTIR